MRYLRTLCVLAFARSFAIASSVSAQNSVSVLRSVDTRKQGGFGASLAERSDTSLVIGSETNAAASSTLASSGNGSSLVGMNGDAVCTSALCIGALVNGSDVQCREAYGIPPLIAH